MPFSPFNVEFADKVRERTNGRLDIKVYMTGELPYKAPDVLPIVQSRKVEIGSAWDTHCEGVEDWFSVLSMPTIFSDRDQAVRMNTEVVMPFMKKVLRKELGVVPVARCIWGTSDLSCNKKLTTVADIKGKKIRCSGYIQQTLIKSLGGIPELRAIEMLSGAIAIPIAAGGLAGAEGATTMVIKGTKDQVVKALKMVKQSKGARLPQARIPICADCPQAPDCGMPKMDLDI